MTVSDKASHQTCDKLRDHYLFPQQEKQGLGDRVVISDKNEGAKSRENSSRNVYMYITNILGASKKAVQITRMEKRE